MTQSASSQTQQNPKRQSGFHIKGLFKRDFEKYEGVPRINIYLLRVLFTLMFVFLTYDSWSHIINHKGPWEVANTAAWCMWGSYSVISFIGILRPLKMLPIILFEIIYKTTMLIIVSYPLYVKNELIGSPAEGMTRMFVWVVFSIIIMPWGYFFRNFIWVSKKKQVK